MYPWYLYIAIRFPKIVQGKICRKDFSDIRFGVLKTLFPGISNQSMDKPKYGCFPHYNQHNFPYYLYKYKVIQYTFPIRIRFAENLRLISCHPPAEQWRRPQKNPSEQQVVRCNRHQQGRPTWTSEDRCVIKLITKAVISGSDPIFDGKFSMTRKNFRTIGVMGNIVVASSFASTFVFIPITFLWILLTDSC